MKGKAFAAAAAACTALVLAGASAAAAPVTVCASGCDYTAIQPAVDAAAPGGTVLVGPGTYGGGIVVDKAGLALKALGLPGSVEIVGPGTTPGGQTFGIDVIANNVTIQGFEISGFSGVHDASGIFVGGLFAGDTAHPADGARIVLNLLHDDGNGVYLWQSNGNKVSLNVVHDSKDFDGSEGVGVLSFNGFGDAQTIVANATGRSGLNNSIDHNVLYKNDRLAVFAGACTEAAFGCEGPIGVHANIGGTDIDHNVAYQNGADGTEAIGLLDASGGTIDHNLVYGNAYRGIYVNDSDGATVDHNAVNGNSTALAGYAGIRVNGASGAEFADNQTNGNGYGIRVTETSGSVFSKNSASHNSVVDLFWDGTGTGNVFTKNRCDTAAPDKATWGCK
jgi:parallel beta-helix repeat protein